MLIPSQKALLYACQKYYIDESGTLYRKNGLPVKYGCNCKGYPHISVRSRVLGICHKVSIHRMVAYQKYGDKMLGPGVVVRHLNSVKADFTPSNIAIGTNKDNFNDNPQVIVNQVSRGARLAAIEKRRFSNEERDAIRQKYIAYIYGYRSLAKEYNCSKSTIHAIVTGKYYSTDAT